MRASNDNGRSMPINFVWVFAIAWVMLALNTVYLADRAYGVWQGTNRSELLMSGMVIMGQLAVGIGSYLGTIWGRRGQVCDAVLAWTGAIAGGICAFSAAFADVDPFAPYPLAISVNVMGPVMAVVWFKWIREMEGKA